MSEGAFRILFVDDDPEVRTAYVQALELEDVPVEPYADAPSALAKIHRDLPGAVVTDIRMPGMDGLAFFAAIKDIDPDIPVILISGHADVPMAVGALRDGAFDFLAKPFAADHLVALCMRAIETRRLVLENRALKIAAERAAQTDSPLIGDSPPIVTLRNTIAQIAKADVDVLIEGETGTGKELVARMLHLQGSRAGKPFIALNCGALPEGFAEVELFGRGGSSRAREEIGRIEQSSGGTLLLDEIDSMPSAVQAKLLRVLEEREVLPIGAERPRGIDLRVVATAKGDLRELVNSGQFRSDLYFRLNMVRLRMPPLRERRSDIPQLFSHFLVEARQQFGAKKTGISDRTRQILANRDWSGNVRELRNFAFATALGLDDLNDLQPEFCERAPQPLVDRLARVEREMICEALAENNGSINHAMLTLGLPRKTLYYRMAKLGINPKLYRT